MSIVKAALLFFHILSIFSHNDGWFRFLYSASLFFAFSFVSCDWKLLQLGISAALPLIWLWAVLPRLVFIQRNFRIILLKSVSLVESDLLDAPQRGEFNSFPLLLSCEIIMLFDFLPPNSEFKDELLWCVRARVCFCQEEKLSKMTILYINANAAY